MATTLKQQLAALQTAPGAKKPKPSGKPSLLFDFRAAADVDLQAIYELGSAGFEELVLLEPRYAPLREPLFSRMAASVSRDQQPPEVVARLDAAIDEFCCLLTQHFLLPAAFKALEFLIRRFKANEHNIDSLMLVALPYHGTNEFVRLLQVLPLDPARGLWSWLAPAQSSGAALPRDLFVARCVNDPRVLHFLCQGARKLGTRKCRSTSFMSFYAVAMCEIVAAVKTVDEGFLSRLLPFISSGLEKAAHRDYQAATLIMVAELCSRATLGKEFVKAVVNSTLRNIDHQPDTVRPVLLLLAQVAVTQPQLTTLSEKALKALLATPNLTKELAALKASHVRLSPLLRVITTSLVTRLPASAPDAVDAFEAPLMELVQSGILEQVAQGLALQVLHAAAEPDTPAGVQAAFQRVLRALDVRHPAAVDAAVNGALAPLRVPGAGRSKRGEQGSSSEGEEVDEGGTSARHHAIFIVVQSTFGGATGQGSTRALCGDTPLTLSAAAASPAAGVRRMAIQQMGQMLMEMEAGSSEAKAQLQSCILQGLQDDDLDVVVAAMSTPCTHHLPHAALLPTLQPTLHRLSQLLCGATKASHGIKTASTAARKALHLLANVAADEAAAAKVDGMQGSSARDQAMLLVLQFVLPVRRVLKVTKAAMKAADQIDHPLATGLATLQDLAAGLDAPALDQTGQYPGASEAEDSSKGSKKGGKKKQQEQGSEVDERGGERKGHGSKGLGGKAKWDARAAQKVAQEEAAQAVEREAVDVLAKAIHANPAALVPEVLRLLALARGGESSSTQNRRIDSQAGATSGEAIQGGGSSANSTPQAADPGLLRVRHVLLLALHRALKGAFEWGQDKEGPRRGRGSSDAPAHVSMLARGLVAACFPELRATLPLLPQQQGGNAEDDQAPLAHWQADANECLESEVDEGAGLPLEAHAGALSARGQATHAAVLCAALHAAMEAAPELDAMQQQAQQQGVEEGGGSQQGAAAAAPPPSTSKGRGKSTRGQAHAAAVAAVEGPPLPTVRDMFVGLGGLQPSSAFEEHLRLLVEKALPELEQRVGFLAALYAAPEESQPPCFSLTPPPAPARASALRLHATYVDNGCSNGSKQQQQREVGITLRHLPHVLAAAHSTDAKVREVALNVLGDMGMQLESYMGKDTKSEQGASAAALAPLLTALHHSSLVEADADAVVVLLRNTFAGAAAPGGGIGDTAAPTPSQTKSGSKRGSRGSRAASTSTQAALASTQLEMEGGTAAVQAAFAHLAQLLGAMGHSLAEDRNGMRDAHVAHLLLQGMLQETWGVSSSHGEAEGDPSSQASDAGGAAGGLPAAATPSQRLALLPYAVGLLECLLHTSPQPLSSQAQHLGALLACCVFSPEPLSAHLSPHPATAPAVRDLLFALLACSPSSPGAPSTVVASRAWFDGATPMRLATLHALRAGPPSRLVQALQGKGGSQQQQQHFHASLVLSLAICSASDASPECRAAASVVIEALPIPDAAVVPVLQAAVPSPHGQPSQQQQQLTEAGVATQETPSKKPKKSAKKSASADAGSADGISGVPVPSGEGRLDLAVLLLEVLQWKAVQGEERVLAAAQQLLEALAGLMGPLAQPHSALASSPESDDEGIATGVLSGGAPEGVPASTSTKKPSKRQQKQAADAAAAAAAATSAVSSSLAGYAAQLILTLMESVARRQHQRRQQQQQSQGVSVNQNNEALDVLSLPLVVRVAQQAPDSAVRNAALSLLAVLAGAKPVAVLSHVLEVLAIVHHSSATTDDSYSHRVGLTALSAVVPAWLEAGKGLQDLWASVVDALPSLPAHRRLGLLTALLQASPQEASLPCALVTLLQAAARALEAPQPEDVEKEQERLGEAAAALRPSEWLLDLATQLSLQVHHHVRLLCFASLLPASVQAADGEAAALLPRIAVTFVAEQIKSRSLRAHHTHGGATSDELQKGCEALMAQALSQVQALVSAREQLAHPDSSAKKGSSSKKSSKASDASSVRRQERAIRLSIEGLYKLFEGLQGIMASQSYMEALLRLAASPGDKVCRRALRLFADKAASLPTEFERITHQPGISKKDKEARAHSLAMSALKVCPVLSAPSLSSASSLTRQAALLAYTSVLRGCGSNYPQPLLAVLPTAVKCASEDASCAVRGTGLAAIAAAAHTCGAQLVPMLPQASTAVLDAVESACSKLSTPTALAAAEQRMASGGDQPTQASAPDAATPSKQQATEDAEEGGEDVEAAVELAAALSALGALVHKLGPFLSPYLPRLLRALLHPATLARGTPSKGFATSSSGAAASNATGEGGTASPLIAAAAHAVRASLPACVPARLLLQPLFGSLPHAMAAGGMGPMAALMRMVAATATAMDASVAAAHHEAIFGFLLRALDVRHTAPSALRGFEAEAEQAAISALVALVLKLSEARFKPLFLRLLEWATLPAISSAGGEGGLGRLVALFGAMDALAVHLRSVLVPYYKYVIDLCVQHLTSSGTAAGRPKKKQRKQQQQLQHEGGDASGSAAGVDAWVLKGRVLRALHRCFLYDTVGFVDQDKVERLLPALVEQLTQELPADTSAAAALAAQCAAPDLDSCLKLGPRSPRDTYGMAAVGALVQLAVAANSDLHWKPLNRQVLMQTRSASSRTRCLALEVVAHMLDRLREEYLVLLPETLPFLSELIEDPDSAVEARAQDVVKLLEEVSGEKLDEYLKTA